MIYSVIGVISGSSLEGLDILFAELIETGGKWNHDMVIAGRYSYSPGWKVQLENAANCTVLEYQLLHTSFGHYIGEQVNHFIRQNNLDHRVHLIASRGHTVFHLPGQAISTQLGNGASIAAETKLPIVSDLCSLDIAFGGQGSPLDAIGKKLLQPGEILQPYPEALIIALMGVLRWREEANMLSSLTGARQDSIGGALWLGTEA
jgi:anhydro-N-acetylmuramic acid kinase